MNIPGHHAIVFVCAMLPILACGGSDTLEPSSPGYNTVLRDGPCDGPPPPADTLMQPQGVPPNAGSDYIDSSGPGDRPPRTVFWVVGFSSLRPTVGELVFVLLRTPNPPPVGSYGLGAVADSTAWLENYTPTYSYDGVPFEMSDEGFVTQPFTGAIRIEESDSTGVIGTLTTEGRYMYDGVVRCLSAVGRFSTRLR